MEPARLPEPLFLHQHQRRGELRQRHFAVAGEPQLFVGREVRGERVDAVPADPGRERGAVTGDWLTNGPPVRPAAGLTVSETNTGHQSVRRGVRRARQRACARERREPTAKRRGLDGPRSGAGRDALKRGAAVVGSH